MTEETQLKPWQHRKTHGKKKKYETADLLWEACVKYFEWVEANPLWENKVTQFQGQVVDMKVAKMRPMTLTGLWVHLDISKDTWYNYKKLEGDYLEVIDTVSSIMFEQKFAGASADLFNANIISRDLGLMDKDASKDDAPKPLTINYTVVDARKDAES